MNGIGEWRNLAVALALCEPGDLIVEVGANVGTETVGFSDIVGCDGRVVAFEPLPANLSALRAVVSGLRQENVALLPYALAAHDGTGMFAVPPASMSQGVGHLLGPDEQATGTGTTTYNDRPVDTTVIDVECRMLDGFADELRGMRLAAGEHRSGLRADRETAVVALAPLVWIQKPPEHPCPERLDETTDEAREAQSWRRVLEILPDRPLAIPRSQPGLRRPHRAPHVRGG